MLAQMAPLYLTLYSTPADIWTTLIYDTVSPSSWLACSMLCDQQAPLNCSFFVLENQKCYLGNSNLTSGTGVPVALNISASDVYLFHGGKTFQIIYSMLILTCKVPHTVLSILASLIIPF